MNLCVSTSPTMSSRQSWYYRMSRLVLIFAAGAMASRIKPSHCDDSVACMIVIFLCTTAHPPSLLLNPIVIPDIHS